MPFNKSYFTGSAFADNAIKNPFIISLLITVLALIIFYAINSSKMVDQDLRDKIKSGFWLLIAVTILTSVHFFVVKKYFLSNSVTQNLQDSVNLISNVSASTDVYDESIKKIQNTTPMPVNAQRSDPSNRIAIGEGETPITTFISEAKSPVHRDIPQNDIINKLPSTIL